MTKLIITVIIIVLAALMVIGGYYGCKRLLELPFRSTNDALHKAESPFTLDFLIPAGFYIDENITIGEMIQQRLKKKEAFYKKWHRVIVELVPSSYRFYADIMLYLFWTLMFMSFFRVFTWLRYSKALLASLLCGGIVYYFMPDFTLGRKDDFLFLGFPILLMGLVVFFSRRRRIKGLALKESI